MNAMWRDLKYGLRLLVKRPGFASISILTLAVGIGATTAIFAVVNAILLRPLPYRDSQQLVVVEERLPKITPAPIPISAPDVVDLQKQNEVFELMAGYETVDFNLTGIAAPERIPGARVSADLFPLLGVRPIIGRAFSEDEDKPGQLVAVLSHRLWELKLGADPDVVGKPITLERRDYTVIGVMPETFQFPLRGLPFSRPADIWVPMAFTPSELSQRGDNFNIGGIARLKGNVTLDEANANLSVIAGQIRDSYPEQVRHDLDLQVVATPLMEKVVGDTRPLLLLLLGAVAMVLLIGSANIANLLLARSAERRREMAIRVALGAGRRRLIGQLLAESLVLAGIGGGLGMLLSFWGADILVSLSPVTLPRASEVHIDLRVLAFAIIVSVASGLLFGLAPAITASKTDVNEALKEGGRSGAAGRAHARVRGVLVVTQTALALMLLIGAGLLIRSFMRVLETDPGFRPEHVLTMSIALPGTAYSKGSQTRAFFKQLLGRLNDLPGATAAGFGTDLPLGSGWTRLFTAEGHPLPPGATLPTNSHTVVAGGYFEALGIQLKSGRFFNEHDTPEKPGVVIISEGMARRFWPGEDPVGKRLKWGLEQSDAPWLTIVGVVADVKQGPLDAETKPHTYEPLLQIPDGFLANGGMPVNLAVRAIGDPASLTTAVTEQIAAIDPLQPVTEIKTMQEIVSESIAPRRFNTYLLMAFATAALLLATIGIYGVVSYTVTQRTNEIGVRMALGARQRDVLMMVVGQGFRLAVIGLAVGLAASFAATRLLASLLYEVSSTDLLTYSVTPLVLLAVALLASYIPARKASHVDPMVALRYE
jgi:putative ABC transport system permease protein